MAGATSYPGIDYGFGMANIDAKGIRYGIIPVDALPSWIWEEFEPQYSMYCPNCGNELDENWDADTEQCPSCEQEIEDGEQYGESADCHIYKSDGVIAQIDSDCIDCWIFASPVTINAQFCSPCAPGAGYLASPCPDGPTTYAAPEDWFDDGQPCPYAGLTKPVE